MTAPHADARGSRERSHWSQWANWVAGAFAIVANIVGVLEIATTSRVLLSLIAGGLAIVAGGVWLWRLLTAGRSAGPQRPLLALNLFIMLLGAGLIGYGLAGPTRGETQSHNRSAPVPSESSRAPASVAPGPTSGGPSPSSPGSGTMEPPAGPTTGNQPGVVPAEPRAPAPNTPTAPKAAPTTTTRAAPVGPFTGGIHIRNPEFGWTLGSGQNVAGEVSNWTSGHQVWMSSRADGTTTELVQGPCPVDGGTFVCGNVQLVGEPGSGQWLHVAVFSDTEAERLNGATTLPIERAWASDEILAYKG